MHRLRPALKISVPKKPAKPQPLVEQKYALLEVLGQGSTAVVRKATAVGSSQRYAVKTIITDDPEMVLVAEKECELISSLRHPNIVEIIELIVDLQSFRIDIIMPLIPGRRLDVLIKQDGALSEDGARPLFTQLMRAVHHCHAHRICHRDIKPENIMVSEGASGERSVVLMDFNAACKGGGLTPTGTRPYMSPEAWRQDACYNEMTDVWSVGVCLYFMLAGSLPWIGQRSRVMALEVSSFPLRLPGGLSLEALSLLSGLLSRDVNCRLLVAGALAHPWCRLSEDEVCRIFGVHGHREVCLSPSCRSHQLKSRKTSFGTTVLVGTSYSSDGSSSLSPVSRTTGPMARHGTWPSLRSEHCMPASQQSVHSSSDNPKWLSPLPVHGRASRVLPPDKDWELRFRREQMEELYGVPFEDPPYRNWEVKARRTELAAQASRR